MKGSTSQRANTYQNDQRVTPQERKVKYIKQNPQLSGPMPKPVIVDEKQEALNKNLIIKKHMEITLDALKARQINRDPIYHLQKVSNSIFQEQNGVKPDPADTRLYTTSGV